MGGGGGGNANSKIYSTTFSALLPSRYVNLSELLSSKDFVLMFSSTAFFQMRRRF